MIVETIVEILKLVLKQKSIVLLSQLYLCIIKREEKVSFRKRSFNVLLCNNSNSNKNIKYLH